MAANFFLLAESFTQRARNLPDMRDLLHRRADEGGQAFPPWLTDDSKTLAKVARRIHDRVAGKRCTNFVKRMIEREIIANEFSVITPASQSCAIRGNT